MKIFTMLFLQLAMLSLLGCDASRVDASCVWTVYNHNVESFVINPADESVLWVEEEVVLSISELTEGYIKFSGTKTETDGHDGRSLKNVPVDFKINRVSGRFDAVSQFVKTDRVGSCDFSDAQL